MTNTADPVEKKIHFSIMPQPDYFTCGPTCLQAVYQYYNDVLPLETVITGIPQLLTGGTLAVILACHALKRGYHATIYSYNLDVFDPTWFGLKTGQIRDKLIEQMKHKTSPRIQLISQNYLEFFELGGELRFAELTHRLIQKHLKKDTPILTGLSATYLYHSSREIGPNCDYDDIRGTPCGHFVVLCGYNRDHRTVRVADPLYPNPLKENHYYEVNLDRLISSILLGVLTDDANLLLIEPRRSE
ncbi:MAG: hypothetical protein GC154_00405 [bacterium]|nr:hypothetical protein [bacterium]